MHYSFFFFIVITAWCSDMRKKSLDTTMDDTPQKQNDKTFEVKLSAHDRREDRVQVANLPAFKTFG